jgi:alkanesulfonate monooxygenase SsuD/methylene tetrahydromethanopterin reductase-like flavin-dependent oxidoreductase (luciferase family)
MRSALFLPIFDDLADPRVLVQLAVEAEDAGWDGVFLWDHVRWREPVRAAADPWIALTAMAATTSRIRIGPMVTPLARRRPAKLARETASLDILSGGRLTLGVGIGIDEFGQEYSITGEDVDDKTRAERLDESLEILEAATPRSPGAVASPRRPPPTSGEVTSSAQTADPATDPRAPAVAAVARLCQRDQAHGADRLGEQTVHHLVGGGVPAAQPGSVAAARDPFVRGSCVRHFAACRPTDHFLQEPGR